MAWASPTGLGVQLAASRRRGELAQAARASLACYARHGAVARAGCPQREVVPLGQLQRRTVPVTVPSCSSESATPSRRTPDSPELAGRRRRSRRLRPRARDSESGPPAPARPCQRRPPAASRARRRRGPRAIAPGPPRPAAAQPPQDVAAQALITYTGKGPGPGSRRDRVLQWASGFASGSSHLIKKRLADAGENRGRAGFNVKSRLVVIRLARGLADGSYI